jgi:hypothetical protein
VLHTADHNGVIRFYGTGSKSADIYGNIVLPNEAGGGFSMSGSSGTHAVRVYNNTFYNSFVDVGSPTSTGTLEFINNIFYELDDVPFTDAALKTTSHSKNLFFRSSGGTLVSSGGSAYTSATLLSGYEASATVADPLFKNAANLPTGFTGSYATGFSPNTDGLSLQANSPALNFGTNLGQPYDSSVNSAARPVSGTWDLGAYQAGTGTGMDTPTGFKATLGPP